MASEAPGTHLEVEIKLEAPAGVELPDLSTLPGVGRVEREATDELDAVYFDATDLRLVRAGITLRRRTGGHDEGWHLKLPEHDGARLEVRRPLGAQPRVVPAPLLALVRATLLGEPLTPVAHIRTTRTRLALLSDQDQRLAEVADDLVVAEAYAQPEIVELVEEDEAPETAEKGADAAFVVHWREIEVELDKGDRELLGNARAHLLATVAKEAPAPSKLVRTLTDRLRAEQPEPVAKVKGAARPVVERLREEAGRLVALDPRVRLGAFGAIPEMRTAVHAIDGLLVVFGPLFVAEPTEALRRELARLAVALDRMHELVSTRDRLVELLEQAPAEAVVGPVRERLSTDLGQALRQARVELVQELNAPGHLALLRRLGAFVSTPPVIDAPLDPEAKRRKATLEALLPMVEAAHEKIIMGDDVSPTPEQVRVAAEVLMPLGKKVPALVEAVRAVEAERAATDSDAAPRRTLLALATRATRVGENAFTYGHLYAALGTRNM